MATTDFLREKRGPGLRYSAQERQAILAGFEQFGGSLYAYAKRAGVTLVTLQRWLRRDGSVSFSGMTGGFVQMEVRTPEPEPREGIEMDLPCGVRLRFPLFTDTAYIGRLARELDR